MKCLILAAGYATRLYPLTENFPKPLLDVGGKTIVDWLIDDLRSADIIDEFVIISNHKFAHCFDEWASEKDYKVTVVDDLEQVEKEKEEAAEKARKEAENRKKIAEAKAKKKTVRIPLYGKSLKIS